MARDICVALGIRIRELRKRRGWRQIDLAQHAQISETYVGELENGQKEVCLRLLETVSAAFDLSPSELLKDI